MSENQPPPLVTVLVDTWNHERFIEKALDSVLAQDFDMSRVEIIVIDDGSTDSTPAKIAAYGDRVRYVKKENGGQATAFNAGIPLARGEIIAMLDGDDWWDPGKLRAVVDALERHPQAVAVGHGIVIAHEGVGDRVLAPKKEIVFDMHTFDGANAYPAHASFFGTSRLTARTQALKKLLPVPEELIVEADEYFFALLPSLAPVVALPDALTHYRIHGGNLFQFTAIDERRTRLKMQVMVCLARVLPEKMRELGVPDACLKHALRFNMVEARRLKLAVEGGPPGAALLTELESWRLDEGWKLSRLPAKLAMMFLALILPARSFYRVRHHYSLSRA